MRLWLPLLASLITAPAWAECPDYAGQPKLLIDLEAGASNGALSQDEKDCLEKNYAAAEKQTTKDKISRVLLVNAYAYNTSYWAKLVQRHLDEVDRSDPDIAYLYAFYLYNNEKADNEEVIQWTEVALERRDTWTGNTYVARVYGLMALRAWAANSVWTSSEESQLAGAENAEAVEEARNRTKTYAREWIDFAKVAGRSTDEPLQLCLSAATQAKACGVDEDEGAGAQLKAPEPG